MLTTGCVVIHTEDMTTTPPPVAMQINFTQERIGSRVSACPAYDAATGKFVGLIEGPAASGRKTWRAVLLGRRVGDYKTADEAKGAMCTRAGSL